MSEGRLDTAAVPSATTLADEVYRRLRDDIVLGRLRPNEHLVEVELAERLEVSRTPIRESLQRLATDGLIVSRRRRWVVYEHSKEEIRNLYEVRMALESFAARLVCERATDEQVERIAAFFDSHAGQHADGGETFVTFNDRFHDLITKAANNSHLAQLIDQNRLYYFNNRVAAFYGADDIGHSNAQHGELVAAIRERDADRAERLTREHVDVALQIILHRLP